MNTKSNSPSGLIGKVIQDRYRIISQIGQGGMGIVYEVEHLLIGRRFALKTLDPALSKEPDIVTRFHREARAAAAIGNKHIIEINDMGQLPDGSPYIVMELLDGHDLRAEIDNSGPMPISRAIDITTQCCEAFESAHKKGIVHRDIKPDNIFLANKQEGSDFVKILDFGISKFHEAALGLSHSSMTKTGAAIGTPYYMSPEQANGLKNIDVRTDVYTMGVVLFEMLVGQVPFSAPTYPLLMVKILQEEPPKIVQLRIDVPEALQRVIFKALSKEPEHRYASITEFSQALVPFVKLKGQPKMTGSGLAFTESMKLDTTLNAREGRIKTRKPISNKKALTIGAFAVVTMIGAIVLFIASMGVETGKTWSANASQPEMQLPRQELNKTAKPPTWKAPVHKLGHPSPSVPESDKPQKSLQHLTTDLEASLTEPAISKPEKTSQMQQAKKETHKKKERRFVKHRRTSREKTRSTTDISSTGTTISVQKLEPNSATRKVVISNKRRATVNVSLVCGSSTNKISVAATSQTTTTVPQQECQVVCSGVGKPRCPLRIRTQTKSIEIH